MGGGGGAGYALVRYWLTPRSISRRRASSEPLRRRSRSDWVLVSRSREALERPEIAKAATEAEDEAGWRTWTDDYSNLIQILK